MKTIDLEDVVEYINNNSLSKRETLYLLHLYKISYYSEDKKEITINDLIKELKKINESLEMSDNTKLINQRIRQELIILEKINDSEIRDDDYIVDLYYETGLLAYEQNLELKKSNLILEKKLNKMQRKLNDRYNRY